MPSWAISSSFFWGGDSFHYVKLIKQLKIKLKVETSYMVQEKYSRGGHLGEVGGDPA